MKEAIGGLAAGLVVAAYLPYLRDIRRGTTQPHTYSWLMWGLLAGIIFAIQMDSGAGAGGLVTLAAAVMCLLVLVLSSRGDTAEITRVDQGLLVLWAGVIVLWLRADQPTLAMVLACLADLVAFGPTVRKSWRAPWSETLSFFAINSLRFALALAAISNYSLTTVIWPAMWSATNGTFALGLMWRRRFQA